MAERKSGAEQGDVDAFLAGIDQEQRRSDAAKLVALMQRHTGQPPRMWPGDIAGFGQYHYRYASGTKATPASSASRRANRSSVST